MNPTNVIFLNNSLSTCFLLGERIVDNSGSNMYIVF